ncbi:serine-rich adhesin for platelets-like [Haliotis rubra]|uniref:serine-rich adhesin for platelets-like n=1 Tax=Haliotis rubra TaxID=36100 RepID=UPI001EE634C1|nr:serine-rich adhesin for platelets-like [Haliotis rubra]
MDFILLSVYILTNLCFSLGGMTPKTIIIASETSRWIHQSGTPPLTDYHTSKQMSSHNRASPYMTMTSVPVQTSITSSKTSSISTTTSTSVNQPIVPSRSTTYHQASARKVISPRYSVNHTDSSTKHPVFSDSALDSSTHTESVMHLTGNAQSELLLQSSMVEEEYDSDTLGTSRGTSTRTVNTETVDNLFIEKSLGTVTDSLKLNNHQTQKSTSSISTFDILRDSNFTASQIADWFESVVSMSTSKSNTTSASGNSSQTDVIEAQSDSENHHTSIYSEDGDQISETLLTLSTTPTSIRSTLESSVNSRYSSSDFRSTDAENIVKKTDSIKYSSASDFLVTYSLINVFKAQKEEETQTTKGTYFANDTSLLGITSLSETSRDDSVSETSDLQKDEETSLSRDLQSSLQTTISTSASPSTQNTDFLKTPSLQSHFMSEPSSRQFSTKLYDNPVEIRGHKTSELTDTDNSLSVMESKNAGSAFSSPSGRPTLPITSSRAWGTDVTRTKISEIISVSETGDADIPKTAADLHSSILPDTEEAFVPARSEDVIVTYSRKQAFSQTSKTSSYSSSKSFGDIKPSASRKAFNSTLLISDKHSSASDMTRLLSNQPIGENSLRNHTVIYSSDQSLKVSATDLVIDPNDLPVSDIRVTASDVESFSSLESIDGNTVSTVDMSTSSSTSSSYLPFDVSTVSARTLKSYSSDLPVSGITVSSLSTQRHASTSMDMHSSELHSKSNAEPYLQFPSISINIKTKHSRQKGTSENIPKDSPTALSTAQEHSTIFVRKENTPDIAVASMRTSMSTFDSISSDNKLFPNSHSDAGYIESNSSETNPSDYSMVDTVADTLYSSQAALDSEIKVSYAATISHTTIRENGSILGGESSSFPISSSYEDNHSQKIQNTKFGREIPDVKMYSSMVDSSHNQQPQLAMTVSQTSTWPESFEISIPKHSNTRNGDGDSTVHEVYRLTSDVLYDHHPSSTYRHKDQLESSKFQWEGREGESTESSLPYVGEKSHSVSTSSTALNWVSSKTASYTHTHSYLPMSTDTIVSSSTMDQIMEQSLILRVNQVADKMIAPQDDSASLGSSTYDGQNIGSKTSDQIHSSSVLLFDHTKYSTTQLARSTTPVLHTSKILEQNAPSSHIIQSVSVVSWVEHRNSLIGSDAVDKLESLGINVESSDVHSSRAGKAGETLQATLSSTDTSHDPTLKSTQSNRQTLLLSEMRSNQLTSTYVKSLLQTPSVVMTSSSNLHATDHTQGPETEAQESDFILKWVFDPKGEDVTSAEFLAKVVKGLELSYEIGLKSQVNVRLRRDTASTNNVNVQIKSTKPRPDGSIEMEFTVTRNGRKILARDAEAAFNKISLEELNRNTGVTSLGMMGLTSLQQEQVLVNDHFGEEPQRKSNINSNNGIQPSATPAVETKDSHGDVSSKSKIPFRHSTGTFVSSDIAAQTITDTNVIDHVMTSIDNSYVSSDYSTDVVIEMVIISNQQEPDIPKEMYSVSSPDIYNGSQQSTRSISSISTNIRPSVTVSESALMFEDTTYHSVLEQVRTSLESELQTSSEEPSPSLDHDHQATVFKPVETENDTSFPNAAAAWDDKLVTTFYDERLLSSPIYIESSLSGIDVTKSTANQLVYKSMSQSSSDLFVTLATNGPQMSSYTASVRSSYEPSFSSSPSITELVQETPLMTSTNGVTLKPMTYGSSSVPDPKTYPFSLASKYSDVTSPSDMIDDFSSFSADMDALASLPGTVSMPISVGFSLTLVPSESRKDSLSSLMPSDYGFDTLFEASGNKEEIFVSRAESTSSPISSTYEPSPPLLNITSFPPANESSATRTNLPFPSNERMDSNGASSFPSMFEDVSSADLSNFEISTPVSDLTPTYDASNDAISSHSTGLNINPTSGAFTNGWNPRSDAIDSNLYGTDTIHLTETILPSTHLRFSSILSPESKVSQMVSSKYIDAAPSKGTVSLPRETSSTLRVFFDASSPITAPTPVETAFSTKVSGTKGFIHSSVSQTPDLKTSVSGTPRLLPQSTSSSPILPLSSYRISTADVSEPPPTMFSGDMDSSEHIISSKSFTNVPMTSSGTTPTVNATNGRYSLFQRFPSMTSTISSSPVMYATRSSTDILSIESSTVSVLSSTIPVISASGWTLLSVSSSHLPNTKRFSSLSVLPPSIEASSALSTKALSTEEITSSEKPSSLAALPPSTEKTMPMSISMSSEGLSSLSTRSLSADGSPSLSTRSLSTEGLSSLFARSLSTEGFSSLSTRTLYTEGLSSLFPRSLSTEGLWSLSTKTSPTEESSPSSFLLSSEGSLFSSPIPFSTKVSTSSTTVLLSSTRPLLFEHSSSSVYPTMTVYSHELTRVDPFTSSQPSVLPPVLTIVSSLSSSPGKPLVSTTTLPFNPSFSAESSASATRTIPFNQSSSRISLVSATTTGPINQLSSGHSSASATITGPINQSSSREYLASATTLPINPSTSGEYLTSVTINHSSSASSTTVPINPSTSGEYLASVTTTVPINQSSSASSTTVPINPSTSGEYLVSATTTVPINPSSGKPSASTTTTLSTKSSSQDISLAPTAALPINPSTKSRTPATGQMSSSVPLSTSVPTLQPTMSAMPTSVQSAGPESSTISTAHPDSSSPPSTSVPASDGPPVDTLMLLVMNIGLDVNITSAQFSRQLEKDLAELYATALKQRRRRDITQRLARHKRQSGVNAQVVSNERDPGDDFKVTTTFAVSDGGDFVPADVAVPVYNRISQEQTSSALAHSVLEPITAAQTSSKPQLEDKKDNSYILILCIVIPAALLVLAILFLVTRMRRRRRANAVGDLPPRYQRGDTLEDHNLTVDVEKGEIVDKTPASTPSLSPRSNSSTGKKVPLLGGVCVLPGVGDGDGLRRQDSDKYRELTETDYPEQVLLADQEKDSHRSLILREKELLEKLGVHENQKEVDSCDEQTLELPRRTRSKKGKGKAASSQYNTVGSECPLLPSSGSMTTVSSIDSGDHTDASDEFTVIIPKTKSPKIEAKIQKESTSTDVSASDDAVASVPIVSEARLTSVAVQRLQQLNR